MSDIERRYNPGVVEFRGKDSGQTIGGYAAVFDRFSDNLGGFVERVAPGFFNKSAGDGWPGVIARWNHDDAYLLGTTAAATLRVGIDGTGLAYDVDPPRSRADVVELVQRGDVRQSSFAFIPYEDEWTTTEQGFPLRTLISGRLMDVAPVNTPAYPDTTSALRSLARRFEAELEDVRSLAGQGELRRFFKRTDAPTPKGDTLTGVEALTYLHGRQKHHI